MMLVTGAAGFIGSNFVLDWLHGGGDDTCSAESVVSLDCLTYAGNLENLASLNGDVRHRFVHGNIGDRELVSGRTKGHSLCFEWIRRARLHSD